MELLRGRSLLAIRKAANPANESRQHALRVARVIADACEGLQAIHDYGGELAIPPRIVHRDISPDNLFLTTDGFVKILDFGLAQTALIDDDTETELLRGKISYIAPELLNRQVATSRSDVWGLGVVAWELLVGRPLFNESTDYETLAAVRAQVIAAPSEIVPNVPSAIDPIILRALARDPSERFESAAAFGRALWEFMISEGEVVQHADLAEWLETLFPVASEVFAAICPSLVTQVVDEADLEPESQILGADAAESIHKDAQSTRKHAIKIADLGHVLTLIVAALAAMLSGVRKLVSVELLPRWRFSFALLFERARLICSEPSGCVVSQHSRQVHDLNADE
jgi:serine/threonine protein kinase